MPSSFLQSATNLADTQHDFWWDLRAPWWEFCWSRIYKTCTVLCHDLNCDPTWWEDLCSMGKKERRCFLIFLVTFPELSLANLVVPCKPWSYICAKTVHDRDAKDILAYSISATFAPISATFAQCEGSDRFPYLPRNDEAETLLGTMQPFGPTVLTLLFANILYNILTSKEHKSQVHTLKRSPKLFLYTNGLIAMLTRHETMPYAAPLHVLLSPRI